MEKVLFLMLQFSSVSMKLFLVLSVVLCAVAAEEIDLESIEILALEENETPISKLAVSKTGSGILKEWSFYLIDQSHSLCLILQL